MNITKYLPDLPKVTILELVIYQYVLYYCKLTVASTEDEFQYIKEDLIQSISLKFYRINIFDNVYNLKESLKEATSIEQMADILMQTNEEDILNPYNIQGIHIFEYKAGKLKSAQGLFLEY